MSADRPPQQPHPGNQWPSQGPREQQGDAPRPAGESPQVHGVPVESGGRRPEAERPKSAQSGLRMAQLAMVVLFALAAVVALASAWARIAEEAEFPADYEGTATPQAHRASEAIQEQIRERIVATNDMRLFSLLHLLGQASLRMEQALWPEDYERMTREVEEALRQATDANARSYTHEEVMQAMQERIDRARDKPC